jgi:hypothetical protein
MAMTTKIGEVIKTEPATRVEEYVQPSELCDTQRRSMSYDAFAALHSHGK